MCKLLTDVPESDSFVVMRFNVAAVILLIVGIVLPFHSYSHSGEVQEEKHIEVSLRMIGHQLLLDIGDTTSRILPIVEEAGRYRIRFESDLEIVPEDMAATVNRVVAETKLAEHYIVEVETCDSSEVVYSYKMGKDEGDDIIPCQARVLPEACYSLLFTLIDADSDTELLGDVDGNVSGGLFAGMDGLKSPILWSFILLAGLLLVVMYSRRNLASQNKNYVSLGQFRFDKINTVLLYGNQKIELTSKEADLLMLLHRGANKTVEREVILNEVWGDEGDYVGRTLDVFISKLRKKLEFDARVKIVNIRGVGYKLVLG